MVHVKQQQQESKKAKRGRFQGGKNQLWHDWCQKSFFPIRPLDGDLCHVLSRVQPTSNLGLQQQAHSLAWQWFFSPNTASGRGLSLLLPAELICWLSDGFTWRNCAFSGMETQLMGPAGAWLAGRRQICMLRLSETHLLSGLGYRKKNWDLEGDKGEEF